MDLNFRHLRSADRGPLVHLMWLVVLLAAMASSARAEIIDRILAVVSGQVITLSDTRAAIELALVRPPPDAGATEAALKQLIDRELTLVEVRRYVPPDPPASAVEGRMREVKARFKSAQELAHALSRSGLNEDRLRDWLRDDLRIQEYLDERFAGAAQPSEDEIDAYFRSHRDELLSQGQIQARARDLARERLTEERRTAIINDWLDGLRTRADIVDLAVTTQE